MALPVALAEATAETPTVASDFARAARDPRTLRILAKSIYRDLRQGGLAEEDVMAVAGDLLGLVAGDVKDRRRIAAEGSAPRR